MIVKMDACKLNEVTVKHNTKAACTVMLVAEGYPGNYAKGKVMTGWENAEGSLLFHAGTTNKGNDIVSNGGRILAITSYGNDIQDALKQSYLNAEKINFEGKYYRTDIGFEFVPVK
jgi:phosphoribosylamine--glycine ligase